MGARIDGVRVWLRPLGLNDATPQYTAWLNDPEVTRYLESGRGTTTADDIRAYLSRFEDSSTDFIFGIFDSATAAHIGNVTINNVDPVHRRADTGIMIGQKDHWGRGYGHEAWYLAIRYAFDVLRVRKLIAGACEENHASIALLRKLGFVQEGRFRGECIVEGRPMDALRFGLFSEEFRR